MSLKLRLIALASAIAIVTALVIAFASYQIVVSQMHDETMQRYEDTLTASRVLVADRITSYIVNIEKQLLVMAADATAREATNAFTEAFQLIELPNDPDEVEATRNRVVSYYQDSFRSEYQQRTDTSVDPTVMYNRLSDRTLYFQDQFIASNSFPLGEKDKLYSDGTQSAYDLAHQKYHGSIHNFLIEFGYYDIFIADAETGHIVYSVFKELDYATSLLTGPYAESDIGEAFKKGLNLRVGETFLTDFTGYRPSYDSPASFISTPIFHEGQRVAVLIFQMPIDRINNIMTQDQEWRERGFGDSAEIYLIGPDKTLRNESRFFIEDPKNYLSAIRNADTQAASDIEAQSTSISLQPVNTPGVNQALQGRSGFSIFADYRNINVLSSYAPIEIGGMTWAIMSEIDEAEAFSSTAALTSSIFNSTLLVLIGVAAGSVILAILMAAAIIRPLRATAYKLDQLSEGDANLTDRIDLVGIREIDDISRGFNQFVMRLQEFLVDLKGAISSVASTSTELGASMEANNQSITTQSKEVQGIQEAVQGFVASIEEVSQQTTSAFKTTERASEQTELNVEKAALAAQNIQQLVNEVDRSSQTIVDLQQRVASISEVLTVINSIADQTNLLALNAAIEAARAGEQGRGFAVVADEVRALASKTQESTITIEQYIHHLDTAAKSSVESMERASVSAKGGIQLVDGVSSTLTELFDLVNEVARANESVANASQMQGHTIDMINKNVSIINDQSSELEESFNGVTSAAVHLANISEDLNEKIERYNT